MNKNGQPWASFGQMDTGKSYEQLKIAEYYRKRELSPKRTIIYDWNNNDKTYGGIKPIEIDDLDFALPKRALVKVQHWDTAEFIKKCHFLRNSVIIFDDATAKFKNWFPKDMEKLCYQAKNWNLEIMFQFHTIRSAPPAILDVIQMYIIKATRDKLPLKDSFAEPETIENLILDCKAENRNYPESQQWATRILDLGNETIWTKNVKEIDFVKSYTQKQKIDDYLNSNK